MKSIRLKSAPLLAPAQPATLIEFPRLALPSFQRFKRALDLLVSAVLGVAALPVACLIALAIFVESGGPVFFGHSRVGRNGRRFRLWKFRTMVVNGDAVLSQYLAENPEAAAEWQATRKLKRDPRVTRIGRLLRRTSLDELPQVWNILRGEMSIAGPRPIVQDEIERYGTAYRLYSLTKPGLTGLWQVSGRNDTTYAQRIDLDAEYVRTWTPATDFRLLLKTVHVVLAGKGAY